MTGTELTKAVLQLSIYMGHILDRDLETIILSFEARDGGSG